MASKRKRAAKIEDNPATDVKKIKTSNENVVEWKDFELVAERENINLGLSKTIVDLLDNENTIPFLCRYRKNLINHTTPDKLRDIQNTLNNVRSLQQKIENFSKTLERKDMLKRDVKEDIRVIKSLEELDFIKSLYKGEGKRTLYEKAVEFGLEPLAFDILNGHDIAYEKYINHKVKELKTKDDVKKGAKDILIHLIVKNKLVIEKIRELKSKYSIKLESKATKSAKDDKNAHKFENYFNFSHSCVNNLKPHQILALFRGENLKILKLSFTFSEQFSKNLLHYSKSVLLKKSSSDHERTRIFEEAFREAFTKRITPFLIRQVRTELQLIADKAAIKSFSDNLKNLLLVMPVKGKKILGIDPGFQHGCKMALISENMDVLITATVFPHTNAKLKDESEKKLVDLLKTHNCNLIALGNGKACRETEIFIDDVMKKHKMANVEYCIVSEQGASIYSCSDIAKSEFPKLDTNIISAISIARRLMDPLSELVKIDSKNLGVGMYQHDVDEKVLNSTLESVVSECVSYVGIDVNCASINLLKHVSGLSDKKAESILNHKQKNGSFKSREELLKVKLIGPKTYTQMIGFIRINKATAGCENVNLLDSTNIHPESYNLTLSILKECGLKVDDFGSKKFIDQIGRYKRENTLEMISKKFKEPVEQVETVLNTLENESLYHDYRKETNLQPDFKRGIQKLSDLKTGQVVTGVVRNCVDFGAFIDIGVQQDGLIHKSKFKVPLKLGDRVSCKIINLDKTGKRISLELISVL